MARHTGANLNTVNYVLAGKVIPDTATLALLETGLGVRLARPHPHPPEGPGGHRRAPGGLLSGHGCIGQGCGFVLFTAPPSAPSSELANGSAVRENRPKPVHSPMPQVSDRRGRSGDGNESHKAVRMYRQVQMQQFDHRAPTLPRPQSRTRNASSTASNTANGARQAGRNAPDIDLEGAITIPGPAADHTARVLDELTNSRSQP